ncbi:MAG: HD domain-containing protein [Planctomycetota bacterium]|jgi:putative nucleotidyltransferase with HDIG domain
MEQRQLDRLKGWFEGFVRGFYGNDEYVNANLKMKYQHSLRTCEEMLYLVEQLGLDANQRRIAEAIALLHDVGRFVQFVEYRTYNDARSTNHSQLGVELLQKAGILDILEDSQRQYIEDAIRYHGLKELPSDLEGEALFYSKLIRDADKIDALQVVTENFIEYNSDPEKFILEVEFPDVPEYSQEVLDSILSGKRIDYQELRTWNDMKLCLLGWVYDVNFAATLKRIRQKRYLETMFDFLPDDDKIAMVREKIFDFVDAAIERENEQ